jgi:nitric oxide synthase-interacting protein
VYIPIQSIADHGTVTQRLGRDSQLPFGYCCLSLHPAVDPVVSPSGHVYSREAILEYILQKTREIKAAAQEYEEFQVRTVRLTVVLNCFYA